MPSTVDSRYPEIVGVDGSTGNGDASRVEKEKNDFNPLKTSAP
jgi:hypothetical protein